MTHWHLECSACGHTEPGDARASVCPACGQPYLVRYDTPFPPREVMSSRWDMWRYSAVLPIGEFESPVSLGEGLTPLHDVPALAEQLGWRLPTHIVYPTGGGTGLIGMWKVFGEMCEGGWIDPTLPLPRMIVAQADGCAPIVRAHAAGADRAEPWVNPETHASGLRVPGPLGDRLILRAVRDSGGDAAAVSEMAIRDATRRLATITGVDAAPEGGCALAVAEALANAGRLPADAEVVIFNTGTGASYRF